MTRIDQSQATPRGVIIYKQCSEKNHHQLAVIFLRVTSQADKRECVPGFNNSGVNILMWEGVPGFNNSGVNIPKREGVPGFYNSGVNIPKGEGVPGFNNSGVNIPRCRMCVRV